MICEPRGPKLDGYADIIGKIVAMFTGVRADFFSLAQKMFSFSNLNSVRFNPYSAGLLNVA